jgi:IS5 family transposase
MRDGFGIELGVAAGNARAPSGQFVLGVRALPGNPYDGHTLAAQIVRLAGERAERAYVYRGYRGDDADRARVFIWRQQPDGLTPKIRRKLRRRKAVEPATGQ